jgi:predicted N-acetyltransferase YhbS
MLAEPLATVVISPVLAGDMPSIRDLSARVFGPGRFVRTAYRVREGTSEFSPWCRVARCDGRIIAALRMTEITIGGEAGALLLGPLAVEPALAGKGHGRRLIAESIDAARKSGFRLVLLVGDLPYYGRLGFVATSPGQIEMPGPVDPARLLAVELQPGALARFAGPVAPASISGSAKS